MVKIGYIPANRANYGSIRNVNLIKINPAYTSKIAGQKYCGQRKMVIHQGASFVIARKGQGFVDKYIKSKKKKSA